MPSFKCKRIFRRRWPAKRRPRPRVRMGRITRMGPRKMFTNINKVPIAYTREVPYNNLVLASGNNKIFFGYAFNLENLPNYSEFTSLFDVYRIKGITAKFRLVQPPEAQNTPATSQFYPDIYVTVDHDDANAPTAVDDVLQYGKCKRGILRPNQWFTYRCHPTPAIQLYRSGTTTAYAPAKNSMWLDLAYTNTPYYAIKGCVSNESAGLTTANLNVEVHMIMYVQFKNSR